MNNKQFSIIGGCRNSMLGDIIASLSFLNLLEKRFPNSYKTAYIDCKCKSILPFLQFHNLIDNIVVSELSDKISEKDAEIFKHYDLKFHPFPPLANNQYYNYHNLADELTYMQIPSAHISRAEIIEIWGSMTELEKCPVLNQYFAAPKMYNTIALWAYSGYSPDDPSTFKRSPCIEFYEKLVKEINKLGYNVLLYGHPNNPKIAGAEYRDLSLFDSIKETLGCNLSITTDSGSSHLLNAYGAKNVTLFTNYLLNHQMNYSAMLAKNWNNQLISLFGKDNINNIKLEDVINAITSLTK